MPFQLTDEIVDAILQNEGRHVRRAGKPRLPAGALLTTRNLACLKPEWSQLPPGWTEEVRPVPARPVQP